MKQINKALVKPQRKSLGHFWSMIHFVTTSPHNKHIRTEYFRKKWVYKDFCGLLVTFIGKGCSVRNCILKCWLMSLFWVSTEVSEGCHCWLLTEPQEKVLTGSQRKEQYIATVLRAGKDRKELWLISKTKATTLVHRVHSCVNLKLWWMLLRSWRGSIGTTAFLNSKSWRKMRGRNLSR